MKHLALIWFVVLSGCECTDNAIRIDPNDAGKLADGGGNMPGLDGGPGDADGDGISDVEEGLGLTPPRDFDGDGMANGLDTDSDNDGLPDSAEGIEDWDGDGAPNYIDSLNDGPPPALHLVAISTPFNSPNGIDFHQPTKSVILSVNYLGGGRPHNFERILLDGTPAPFSNYAGLVEEVKIATARVGNPAGIEPGTMFTGNGKDGEIVRISPDGSVIDNPWVSLPGDNNGLLRGSLYVDRTGVFGGDLIVATSKLVDNKTPAGEVWRINPTTKAATRIVRLNVHLEGLIVVPNFPVRYGPIAGKILVGAEEQGLMYVIDSNGKADPYSLGVRVEDIDIITPNENFFGLSFKTMRLLGATVDQMKPMVGDILLTQEDIIPGTSGLYRLQWNGSVLTVALIPLSKSSASVGLQWEHVTMAGAGIREIPQIN